MKFSCPNCSQRIESATDVSGMTVKCPVCRTEFSFKSAPDPSPAQKPPPLPAVPAPRDSTPDAPLTSTPPASKAAKKKLGAGSAIIAIAVGFLVLRACVGMFSGDSSTTPAPSRAIEHVLNECEDISKEVNAPFTSPGQIAQNLARRAQAIDTRDCPQDFRVAFQEHINAWREAAPYLEQDTGLTSFLEGLYSGYTGDFSVFGAANYNAQLATQNINATYNRLVTIATAHGARVPHSVVE